MKTVMKTVMKSLIPLLVVASAVAAVDVQKRVLNGKNCPGTRGTHYVVLVPRGSTDFDDRFCGGNLISDEWILTAGHCEDGRPEYDVILGKHPSSAGERMEITATSVKHYFPDNHVPVADRHDIMLVKLPRAATSHPTITLPPVGCASPAPPFPDNPYTLMGWSYTDVDQNNIKNQKLAEKLQCGDVKLDQHCTRRDQTVYTLDENDNIIPFYIGHHLLCSYEEVPCNNCASLWEKIVSCCIPSQPCPSCSNGVHCTRCPNSKRCEACEGDSGGSLVKKVGNVDVLYGVTVAGPSVPSGLTYYMDVCAYRKWIRDEVGV